MGDIADMTLDFDDYNEDYDDECCYCGHGSRKNKLRCRSCNTTDLAWQRINNRWTLIESSGKVHICQGYEPRLDVLQIALKKALAKSRADHLFKLQEQAKKRGQLSKVIARATDAELVDILSCFVRDSQIECSDYESSDKYSKEISILKNEIINRMSNRAIR